MLFSRMLVSLVLLALSAGAYANDEETLRHFKTVLWPQAYRTQDVALLDELLHAGLLAGFTREPERDPRTQKDGQSPWAPPPTTELPASRRSRAPITGRLRQGARLLPGAWKSRGQSL